VVTKFSDLGLTVGEIIRRRREGVGETQNEVARNIGISPEYLGMLEKSARKIDLRRVPALARCLGIDPASLAKVWLHENEPEVFRLLFGDDGPEVKLGKKEDSQAPRTVSEITAMLMTAKAAMRDLVAEMGRKRRPRVSPVGYNLRRVAGKGTEGKDRQRPHRISSGEVD